jgi:hypothetical protein
MVSPGRHEASTNPAPRHSWSYHLSHCQCKRSKHCLSSQHHTASRCAHSCRPSPVLCCRHEGFPRTLALFHPLGSRPMPSIATRQGGRGQSPLVDEADPLPQPMEGHTMRQRDTRSVNCTQRASCAHNSLHKLATVTIDVIGLRRSSQRCSNHKSQIMEKCTLGDKSSISQAAACSISQLYLPRAHFWTSSPRHDFNHCLCCHAGGVLRARPLECAAARALLTPPPDGLRVPGAKPGVRPWHAHCSGALLFPLHKVQKDGGPGPLLQQSSSIT